MSRYQKLNKNELLNAAERVIQKQGAHALSIGSVAAEAKVSRGGIQSNFGSRAQLIDALFARWDEDLERYKKEIRSRCNNHMSELDVFLAATRLQHLHQPEQMSAMMILTMQTHEQREASQIWMEDKLRLAGAEADDERGHRLRLLVNEAMVMMHSMQLAPLSDEEWAEVWEDLDGLFDRNTPS
ncbi:TetR/AcrR family transcriptional regulator [Pseudovibrio ascidiaceicola]|jgi:AcrR family transcriptional regulator|uniref:TetR/AcrR family transcriptional regulator n=1 Tax=Pseudovibrio ascidiaceicola TaxID=285279 RepID=UPI000D68E21A|nr:TetR/AcrR family transcriptional regulator [Pseudovibrio ascidiaceicola]